MLAVLRTIEGAAMWLACAALLLMGTIVTVSVIGRVVFNMPVPDDLIMVGLLMVCVIVLPLSYVERTDGHITVTVIADHLPLRVQYALRTLGNVLFIGFFGIMGYMLAVKIPAEFSENLYYDGQLDIPTWPMKLAFVLGVAVFVTRCLVRLAENVRAVILGRAPASPVDADQ